MSGPGRARYRLLRAAAAGALFWERLWPRLWPLVGVAALFAAVALLDLLPTLAGWLHASVLAVFAVAAGIAAVYAAKGVGKVAEAAARHRLERDSGLAHRPLTALEDRLVAGAGDTAAERLWLAHRARIAAAARRLDVRLPAPNMARREPWGVRAGVVLALAAALVAGAGDAGPRFARAVAPQFGIAPSGPVSIDVWINPPAYTGVAPLFLDGTRRLADAEAGVAPTTVLAPQGSTLLAQVAGLGGRPELVVDERRQPFARIGDDDGGDGFRVETTLESGGRLAVRAGGRELVSWPLSVLRDQPPEAAFARPPAATPRALLRVAYRAADDYGVQDLVLTVRRTDGKPTPAGAEAERIIIPLAALSAPSISGSGVHDLTAHAWAGRRVLLALEARDGAGQTGASPVVDVVLPERAFQHPVAREIVAQRKRLFEPTAAVRAEVGAEVEILSSRPEHFAHDATVSLALGVAAARLARDRRDEAVASVREMLWETALRLEEGSVPIAERELRDARQRLWEALRADTDIAEIERLIDELRQALDKYLAALMAEMARRGEEMSPFDADGEMLRSEDLQDLIEMAREFARTGARDSARQLLGELQRILDGLRAGLDPGTREDLAEAQKLLGEMRKLTQRQQELLDQTFQRLRERRAEAARPGEVPQRAGDEAAASEQEALRRRLGELMLGLDEFVGEIPAPLQEAERSMNDAAGALGQGRLADAVPAQSDALEKLRQAQQSAAQSMAQRLGGMAMMFSGGGGGGGEDGADPFGRSPADGYRGFTGDRVNIPDRTDLERAHEILRELRRRAGERGRPRLELDYIERLLRQF